MTSTDVAFYCYLAYAAVVLSPDNDGAFTPGEFPQDLVSVATPNPTTAVITLSKSFNPSFQFLDQIAGITPLPAHAWSKTSINGPIVNFRKLANAEAIYKFLNAESSKLSTYGSDALWQVVDGPYKVESFDPSTDGNVLVANPNYSGPVKPHITTIDNVPFTSTDAEFNQLLSRNLDVGFVDFSDLPQVSKLKSLGYDIWGYPDFGNNLIVYNFKDKTGDFDNVISQLYIRQALAHLQDEPGVIAARGMFDGAAGAAYGPVPAVPKSPFAPANALTNPYLYSISTASKLLSSHGWKVVPNGVTTCSRAGTGPNECGAGIPAGTSLTWNLVYSSQPAVIEAQCEAIGFCPRSGSGSPSAFRPRRSTTSSRTSPTPPIRTRTITGPCRTTVATQTSCTRPRRASSTRRARSTPATTRTRPMTTSSTTPALQQPERRPERDPLHHRAAAGHVRAKRGLDHGVQEHAGGPRGKLRGVVAISVHA